MKFKIFTVKLETDCDHFFEKEQKKCSLYSFASLWLPLALTSVPLRCCQFSQNTVTHRAQQNLRDFTAIAIDNML